MSNLKALLEKLGFKSVDDLIKRMNDDTDATVVDEVLEQSQVYAKPFYETEWNQKIKDERHSSKGKGMKEALNIANEIFGNPLTNKEIEEVMDKPENKGKTVNAVLELLKEKVHKKTGTTETELQKMLDAASGEKATLQKELADMAEKYKNDLADGISKVRLDSLLTKKLLTLLPKFTSMNPAKAAELIKNKIFEKALLKVKDDDNISLYDLSEPETLLKKNKTELQSFDGLIESIVKEYELPVDKSPAGTKKKESTTKNDDDSKSKINPAAKSANSLASAMSAINAE